MQTIITLPIEERARAHRFYSDALGLEPVGEPWTDGIPEPLQFKLGDGVNLMLDPAHGIRLGARRAARGRRRTERVPASVPCDEDAEVDVVMERADRAGATVVLRPRRSPGATTGSFTDPDGHLLGRDQCAAVVKMAMLIYSMGVSVDGFIADREGAFAWSVPDDEQFRFHLAAGRRARRLSARPQALRDHAGVGDGSVAARQRGHGPRSPTSGALSRRSSSAARSTAFRATPGSPRRRWPRRSLRRSTRPTGTSRSAAPAWPRQRSSSASSTSCACSATRSSSAAARPSCRRSARTFGSTWSRPGRSVRA